MATPKPENFLILEKSVTDRLVPRWKRQFAPIKAKLKKAIADDDPITAQDVIESLDELDALYKGMHQYLVYISTSALLFGASRVRPLEETSFMTGPKQTPEAALKGTKQLEMFLMEARKTIKKVAYAALSAAERQKANADDRLVFQKADKIKTLDEYMDQVEKAGDDTISAAASLHTSRLSNYGFTVEAMVTGIERFQVDEMLDSRTCPVCRYMHGKTFEVERAYGTLSRLLEVDNPDDLKTMAPFPKQNAQAIADMKKMSMSELEQAGYNIPPYHPGCRGLLAEEGSVVEIEEQTPVQTLTTAPDSFTELTNDLERRTVDGKPSTAGSRVKVNMEVASPDVKEELDDLQELGFLTDSAVEQEVVVGQLKAITDQVRLEDLQTAYEGGGSKPLIVELAGSRYVYSGTEAAMLAKLSGANTILADLVVL